MVICQWKRYKFELKPIDFNVAAWRWRGGGISSYRASGLTRFRLLEHYPFVGYPRRVYKSDTAER